jgi:16S rRNA (guanine527-N7)-methyltransferase
MIEKAGIASGGSGAVGRRLNAFLEQGGLPALDLSLAERFEDYLSLLLRWNARMNLTAIRDEEGILSRHFVESIACARIVPPGVTTLLDLGSGAGFPGIPIALCRPEISVTLAESQNKKAAFLQEAVRTLGLGVRVHAGRAEKLTESFECVTLRAVDRMEAAVTVAGRLVSTAGWMVVMTTGAELPAVRQAGGARFAWEPSITVHPSEDRLIILGRKSGEP